MTSSSASPISGAWWRSTMSSSWDPERVFFEILNEPEMRDAVSLVRGGSKTGCGDPARRAHQIRSSLRVHDGTMTTTWFSWNRCAIPMSFTFFISTSRISSRIREQPGARITGIGLKDLHYPSDPQNADAVAAAVPEAVHRFAVIRYGQDHWDAARIEAEINQAAEWAKQNGVPTGMQRIWRVPTMHIRKTALAGSQMYARRSNATKSDGPCGTIPDSFGVVSKERWQGSVG